MKRVALKRKTPLRRGSKLQPASKKQAARLSEYAKLKAAWLPLHPRCEVQVNGRGVTHVRAINGCPCGMKTDSVHHMALRRGRFLCDTRYWMAMCAQHHDWIHGNANLARELGYLLDPSKL